MPIFKSRRKKAGTAPLKKKATTGTDDGLDVEAFLEDLEVEINARCKTIELHASHLSDSIRNVYAIELTKLPKNIRNMNAKEFCEQFDGDISLVIERDRKKIYESMEGMENGEIFGATIAKATRTQSKLGSNPIPADGGATIRRSTRAPRYGPSSTRTLRSRKPYNNSSLLATPAPGAPTPKFNPNLPCTPAVRAPRRGESIMSINGSPLVNLTNTSANIRATIKGKPGEGDHGSSAPSIAIALGSSSVDLSDPTITSKLTEEEKEATLSQLAMLQSQVSSLLARMKG